MKRSRRDRWTRVSPPSGHWPAGFDLIVPDPVNHFVKMDYDAAMIGHDAHPFTDLRTPSGSAQVQNAMLLGEPRYRNLGPVQQRTKAVTVDGGRFPAQPLAAGIHYRLPRDSDADDSGKDGQRTVVPAARAGLRGGAVVEDVGAGPDLGQPFDQMAVP